MMQDMHSLEDWYTASVAAKILAEKSQREVKPDYLRSLARQKKICTLQIGPRTTLYLKVDVDAYLVEDRGKKAGLAAKERARKKEGGNGLAK